MRLVLVSVVLLVAAGSFAATAGADVTLAECPSAPGPPDPGTITDAAIEVRNLRIEQAQACAVAADWALYVAQDVRETYRLVGWLVGLTLVAVFAPYVREAIRA